MIDGGRVIELARDWIGTPYRHQGSVKGVGVDCIGLVYGVARELNIVPEGFTMPPYSAEPVNDQVRELMSAYLDRVETIAPGDVLVFKFSRFGQHVGIFTGRNIIHATHKTKTCVEQGYDSVWKLRTLAGFRFR